MEFLFFILVVALFWTSVVMPWMNRSRIRDLEEQVDVLLSEKAKSLVSDKTASSVPITKKTEEDKEKPTIPERAAALIKLEEPTIREEKETSNPVQDDKKKPAPKPEKKAKENRGEIQWGTKMPIWIGAVALMLSGLFLVKYSIDQGLLSPSIRVTLGLLFGAVLTGAGYNVHGKERFANRERISQGLCGAGVAVFYGSFFAATQLYNLIPSALGFAGMAGATVLAVLLSLRMGPALAMLGLTGGFLTPAMVGAETPNVPFLLFYLYFVMAGAMVVIRKQEWWWMSIPAAVFGFGWLLFVLDNIDTSGVDSFVASLFLFAMGGTLIWAVQPKLEEEHVALEARQKETRALFPLGMASVFATVVFAMTVILMGALVNVADYSMVEWGMFGLMTAGVLVLAWVRPQLYGIAPYMTLAVNMVVLFHPDNAQDWVLPCFAAMYFVYGHGLAVVKERTSGIFVAGASGLAFYLLGYFIALADGQGTPIQGTDFWAAMAVGLALFFTGVIVHFRTALAKDNVLEQYVTQIYGALAALFIALGALIGLEQELVAPVLALEVLVLTWIGSREGFFEMRKTATLLFALFLLAELQPLFEFTNNFREGIWVEQPWSQLFLISIVLFVSSYFARLKQDGVLSKGLEIAGMICAVSFAYIMTRTVFNGVMDTEWAWKASFVERGFINNVFFVLAAAAIFAGHKFERKTILNGGILLFNVVLARIALFDCVIDHPMDTGVHVGNMFLLNGLTLSFGLPCIWALLALKFMQANELTYKTTANFAKISIFMCGLLFISFQVTHAFHGGALWQGETVFAEILAYSMVWMVTGAALLAVGIWRKEKPIRIASLVLMGLTVVKVFIYDMAELDGLYRVVAFMGLGVALIGLGYVYARYVYPQVDKKDTA